MTQQRATIIINRTPELSRQQHDDFMRLHVGKSAFDLMMDDIARRNQFIQRQCLNFGNFKIPTAQHLFYLSNTVASSKAIKLLSALTHSIFNTRTALYELARQFAALSLHELRKQKNINDRVVISMTEKSNFKNLNNHLFNFWSLNNDLPHRHNPLLSQS